ncbi:MAG: bifunctional folylpolyglutamate synthase/dihydrofolate synthase [Hyphomicrobiaceae bacterium]
MSNRDHRPATSDTLLAELKELHPLLIDLSLDRIRQLMTKLGDPQDEIATVIHVAGTNGKGSTVAFLSAMLQAAGKRVHTYTSPHLVRFHERIQLAATDGKTRPIDEENLVHVLDRVRSVNDNNPMTFFEITTAAAFLAFAETPADCVLLEVGLGGRLDATNLIPRPAASVITPISIDHADKLGDTLEKIAFEKAGILKSGVTSIIGPQPVEALTSIEQTARRIGAKLIRHGEHYDTYEERGRLIYQSDASLVDLPLPGLIGRNQIVNAGVAIATLQHTFENEIPISALEYGLAHAKWPARFTRLNGVPFDHWVGSETELWIDGGHNAAAGISLAQTLADLEERASKPAYLVVGMMAHKEATNFLSSFCGLVRSVTAVSIPKEQNALPATVLAANACQVGLRASTADGVEAAIRAIECDAPGPKRIVVCGSLYLAGHVLAQQGANVF